MFGSIFNADFIASSIRIAIPLALAGLGGVFSERSGVINIGLEGIMLTGAFTSIAVTNFIQNPWLGILAAIIIGIFLGLIHGITCITFKANQIVSGVAINLFASGITVFFSWLLFNETQIMAKISLPIWGLSIPNLGEGSSFLRSIIIIFAHHSPLVYLTIIIFILSHLIIFRTPFGLRLRSVGEYPQAADTMGVNVIKIRYIAVMTSGALAGLAGSFLSLEQAHFFVKEISGGRGFIALAAMIFGKWTPFGTAGAALLFGFGEALAIRLQSVTAVPVQFINMVPYLLAIFVLVSAIGRAIPPAADGIPYEKEVG
ncbi:MAG: ABC transporter permease [Candidatus Infernicultor aquiphilus]|uniref:ABC transporter permease n=1 Tax=Candidatus Infernicultor aquiphilus TaxID=1805029 RepID=A0A1J5GS42_9BACT|nr:ABC transporter permease [bacterium]OIP75084.1 MAG: branched-chain amino acid ABC transporter permease [Candidatus Atribacteria bacterium CG2_30_33_13]PIU24855.1 MAG: ABC transporter permease [Candidatus Atribacteria bacterium CG08_land_8_20_14_0_20_33_29]PIW11479.1 MAG: ABC transporter permease [Candidatus Atribacteria bacterium CG17_big_fil_post_rev_8_21_14_2_50_34_11]PIX33255.1 MAG: ABC transporter permease [Candidatus Atribacteria bacterium CG_4_8_14_3_um_filter_34_18]PIY33548.1 MAG: AB